MDFMSVQLHCYCVQYAVRSHELLTLCVNNNTNEPLHGAFIGTLGLMECKKYVLYVIRKR